MNIQFPICTHVTERYAGKMHFFDRFTEGSIAYYYHDVAVTRTVWISVGKIALRLNRSLSRGCVLPYKLRRAYTHVLLKLPTEKVNVGKITHFCNLSNGIPTETQKIAGVVDLQPNHIFFGWDAVFLSE